MILVFFLITLLFLFILFTICVIFSNLQIQIRHFKFDNIHHISPKYIINISLKLFNKIKWISINLDNNKIKRILNKIHLEKINIKEIEKNINLEEIKQLIDIKPKILSLDLNIQIGLENVILTSFLIPIICTIISIVLSKLLDLKNMDDIDNMDEINNIKYIVTPIYNRGNIYNIQLNTIVNFKITTAIKSMYRIYKINKKNKEERKNKENRKDKNNRKIKTGFNYSV